MNLLLTVLGWAAWTWGMFTYEKDTKYDAYEKEFPYRTYVERNWENWVWNAIIAALLVVAGIKGLHLNVVPLGEFERLGWSDLYYAACGPIGEIGMRWIKRTKSRKE